ncbi:hypothetical protein JCM24511_09768 [Saitozyma sp. JCM 24511]|nr:hypothetical protein JCM24511_09768 [Saitozyma sp. JCM 24511]
MTHAQRSLCEDAFSLPGRRLGDATDSNDDSASGNTALPTFALAHPVSEGQTLRAIRTRILHPSDPDSDSARRSGTDLRSMIVEPVFDSTSRAAQAGGWDWTSSPIEETIDTSSTRQPSGARQAAECFPFASRDQSPPPSYAQALQESSERLGAWFDRARSVYDAESPQPEDPLESLSHLYRSMLAFTPQERHDGRLQARAHGLERAWETMDMSAVLAHLVSGSGWQGLGEDDMENLRHEIDRTRCARTEAETGTGRGGGTGTRGRGRNRGWGREVVRVPGLQRGNATLGEDLPQEHAPPDEDENEHEHERERDGIENSHGRGQEQELSSALTGDIGKVSVTRSFLGETVSTIANIASSAVLPTAAILVGLLAAEHRRSARENSLVTLANSLLAISDLAGSIAGSDIWQSVGCVVGSEVWESVSKGWTEGLGDAGRVIARTAASGIGDAARTWMERVRTGWAG